MTAKSRSMEGCGVVNTELDRHDEHARELAHDPHAEPSAEWGWHGGFPRAARIGGWIVAAIMFLMLIGNHQGRVEDLWLIATGLIIVGILVRDLMKRRTSWRR
jgi:Protein of unknown function (DUF2631)